MLRPRRFDEEGLKAYLDDVRPRFLVLRVRADKANIIWGVPLWAAEEIVAFAVGAAALLRGVLPLMPAAWRDRLAPGIRIAGYSFDLGASATAEDGASADATLTGALVRVLSTANDLAGGGLRDLLRLPPGEPYVKVQTDTAFVEIVAY